MNEQIENQNKETGNEEAAIQPYQQPTDELAIDLAKVEEGLRTIKKFQAMVKQLTTEGVDYGVIPGTTRPTLLKPGAEKIAKLMRLADSYQILNKTEDYNKPFFAYTIKCSLKSIVTGNLISEGMGQCNSYESKYRYRWSFGSEIPKDIDKTALRQRTGIGRNNKPYTLYRLENEDVCSQVNTILKMAKKRALVDAALSAGRLSEIFTQDLDEMTEENQNISFDKMEWQRENRKSFKDEHGHGQTANYRTGKLRETILQRDKYSCVLCGMTDEQHKAKWNKPITIDHIDKDRSNNTMDNLQTLCLSCHGQKDIKPELTEQQVIKFKDQILQRRKNGETYQFIANDLGFSSASIWKWHQRWTIDNKPAKEQPKKITTSQRQELFKMCVNYKVPNTEFQNFLKTKYNIKSTTNIMTNQYDEILAWIKSHELPKTAAEVNAHAEDVLTDKIYTCTDPADCGCEFKGKHLKIDDNKLELDADGKGHLCPTCGYKLTEIKE